MYDGESKVQCYKQRYYVRICTVRSMSQGKLNVVKQKMAGVSISILWISDWNGWKWANLIQITNTYTTVGKKSIRRNEVALMVSKRVWNVVAIVVVQLLSWVWLFLTPWPAVCQAPLSITLSLSWLKLMSIESMMTSYHLIPCHTLLLLPSIFPIERVTGGKPGVPKQSK